MEEKLKEKIVAQREKRRLRGKFAGIKTLGESDEETDNALAWVKKSKKIVDERKEAEKKVGKLYARFQILILKYYRIKC